MNYIYTIGIKEVIISEDEHRRVCENMKLGKSHTFLRPKENGIFELIIKHELCGLTTPTERLTDEQFEKQYNPAQLGSGTKALTGEVRRKGKSEGLVRLGNWARKQNWFSKK